MNQKLMNIACISLAGLMSGIAWADPTVTDITLVNEKRISRTVFEYTYKATITNDGIVRKNVRATLNSAGSGTSIIEGIVDIGELSANQVMTSTDTFTLQQDRKFAFDRAALVWSFSGEAVKAPGNLGELIVFPKVIPAAQDTKVMVMIKIDDPSVFSGNPRLERLDSKGNVQSTLATFVDDGTQGDAVAGDRWYTAQVPVNDANPGQILVRAAATIKSTNDKIYSLIGTISVELGADTSGSFATLRDDKLVFRSLDGVVVSEVDLSPTSQPLTDQTGNYLISNIPYAIPTKDQKKAGILTLSFQDMDGPAQETDTSSPYGSSFSYRDANSVLWSKSLPPDATTQYFVPDDNDDSSALFSADGNRILLIEVEGEGANPKVQIYDVEGALVKEFSSKIQALFSSRISENGRFVLLKGYILASEGGGFGFEAFDIDTDQSRIQSLDLDTIGSYDVLEDADGRFEVWSDGTMIYQLP